MAAFGLLCGSRGTFCDNGTTWGRGNHFTQCETRRGFHASLGRGDPCTRCQKILVQVGGRYFGEPGAVVAVEADCLLMLADAMQDVRDVAGSDSWASAECAGDLLARGGGVFARAFRDLQWLIG